MMTNMTSKEVFWGLVVLALVFLWGSSLSPKTNTASTRDGDAYYYGGT